MRGIATPTVRDGEYGFLQWPDCELGCPVPVPGRISSSTQPDASIKYCPRHDSRTPDFVAQGECWIFLKSYINSGYGVIGDDGWVRTAHRLAVELAHGPIAASMHIHHTCAVKLCVQPNHLVALSPGAHSRLSAKLNWDLVAEIRLRAANGERPGSIALDYPVSVSAVRNVISGKTWPADQAGEAALLAMIGNPR
jgi:hypothetical protein